MHNTQLKTALPSDEDILEVRTRSGRISRPPSLLIEETGWSRSPTRSRSRSSLHPPRTQSVYRHPSPTPSIAITESESNTQDRGRSCTRTYTTLSGTFTDKYKQYQLLLEERANIKQKAKGKWEETKEATCEGHTDMANQYTQETDAIVKTVKELDNQLEDIAYEKDKASLELNKYKLGKYQGTIQKEELEYRTSFFQERVNKYEEGERPFQKDTEQFVTSLQEEQEELLEELQEQEIEEKKPISIPGQSKETPKNLKPTTEKKPSHQELEKSADVKPEQLFKGKGKEIEEAQLPPPEKSKQKTTMASEKHDFKPPKPRTYSGKGKDKDPEIFEQWKQEVLDYFDLTSMPPSKHIQALGYFVNDTARDYYHTKRRKHSDTNPVIVDEMLKGIKNHCIPTTSSNVYWKQWD